MENENSVIVMCDIYNLHRIAFPGYLSVVMVVDDKRQLLLLLPVLMLPPQPHIAFEAQYAHMLHATLACNNDSY